MVYSNAEDKAKRYKTQRFYQPKGIIKSYKVITIGKNFYDQPVDFDLKQYEKTKKSTTSQGEVYTAGCFFVYDYIKNHYRLIVANLSRQKRLDSDPKAIQ